MRGQHIFNVLYGHLFLRNHAPWQIIRTRRIIRIRTIPYLGVGVQIAQHEPCTGCIVYVIRIIMTPKHIPWIPIPVKGYVQMIGLNKFFHIRRTHIFFLFRECIRQIKLIQSQLIGHHHIDIIRHPSCHPVMSTDGLQPPDFFRILKCNSIHLIGAILLQQTSEPLHTFPRAMYVRKHQTDKILLAKSSRDLLFCPGRRLINHQWIGS